MPNPKFPDRTFGLNASQMLHELLGMYRQFREDPLNTKLARDCSSHVWHLFESIFHEFGSQLPFANLTELRTRVESDFAGIAYLHDICSATKHVNLSRPKANIKDTRLHRGGFSRDFDRHDFDTSRLEIVLSDGQRIDFEDVLDQAIDYWTTFVKQYRLFEIEKRTTHSPPKTL